MNIRDLTKLVDMVEEKYGDYVYAKIYGDGSGELMANDEAELVTWDDENEMERNIKLWLKE
jgi:hypothetical protein